MKSRDHLKQAPAKRFRGTSGVTYALVLGLIAAVAIVAISGVGSALGKLLVAVGQQMDADALAAPAIPICTSNGQTDCKVPAGGGIVAAIPASGNVNGQNGQRSFAIPAGYYDGSKMAVAIDSLLTPGNIRVATSIFGVTGTIDTSVVSLKRCAQQTPDIVLSSSTDWSVDRAGCLRPSVNFKCTSFSAVAVYFWSGSSLAYRVRCNPSINNTPISYDSNDGLEFCKDLLGSNAVLTSFPGSGAGGQTGKAHYNGSTWVFDGTSSISDLTCEARF